MTTTERPSLTVDISLTENAAEQVRGFLEGEKVPLDTGGVRVAVTPGGCSGFKYNLTIEDSSLDDDIITDSHGIHLFVDAFSAQYLAGTTIDYVSSINGQGFAFNNPSSTGACGCGSSFSA